MWRHGTGLGSKWDHGSHNQDIPDADIGHVPARNFLENIEKTFRDLDQVQTACAQLHGLKITSGTTAEDYMAQFDEMLVCRTSFNDTALKDISIQGLLNAILQKIFTQVTLPNGLAAWKTVI